MAGAYLHQMDLTGIDFTGTDFRYADLSRADLSNAVLKDCSLLLVDGRGMNLEGAQLENIEMAGARLDGARLERRYRKQSEYWQFVGKPRWVADRFPPPDSAERAASGAGQAASLGEAAPNNPQ